MALTSVSPIDGRYEGKTKCLQGYFSEMALMRYRIYTEINYLIKLLETPMLKSRVKTSVDQLSFVQSLKLRKKMQKSSRLLKQLVTTELLQQTTMLRLLNTLSSERSRKWEWTKSLNTFILP